MALSGSNILSMVSTGRVKSMVEWSATQDRNANRSTITVKVYSYFAGAIYASNRSNVDVNIAGQTQSVSRVIGNHPNGGKILVATVTKTVNHNSDGSLTANIKVTNPFNLTYAGTYISSANHNFNIVLDRIPRNSTLGTVSDFVSPTNSPSVQIIAADSSFTHIIDFRMNNKTLFSRSNLKGGTHNLNLTAAEQDLVLKEMTKVVSSPFTIVLGTYNSGKFTGTAQSKNGKVTVATNVIPSIGTISVSDYNYADPTGGIFVGASRLEIDTTATAGKFASISQIEVTYNGFTYRGAKVITNTITDAAPTNEIRVIVTDSRGRKATKAQSVLVDTMKFPRILNKAYRSNSSGTPDPAGRYLTVECQMDSMSFGSGNGWWIKWKATSSSTWITLEQGGEESVWFKQTYNLNLNPNSSYEVQSIYQNYLYKSEQILPIPTDFVTFDVRANGKGLGIGKVSEKDALEVAFPTEFGKPVKIENVLLTALGGTIENY